MWSTRQVETLRLEEIVYVARLVGRTSGRMVGPDVALGIGVDEYIRNGFSVRSVDSTGRPAQRAAAGAATGAGRLRRVWPAGDVDPLRDARGRRRAPLGGPAPAAAGRRTLHAGVRRASR